jgi:hypothetical protein
VRIDAHKKDLFIAMLIGQQKTAVTLAAGERAQCGPALGTNLERESPGPL